MISIFLGCLSAYLIGGFPTAYWAGKIFKGVDIRKHGSGNVGATNAARVLGRNIGAGVFAVDLIKGWLPVFFATLFMPEHELAVIGVGVAAILGHVFTPYLAFKGGKGVATGAGVLFGLYPPVFFVALTVWLIAFFLSRIVSVSSMLATVSLPISSIFFQQSLSATLALSLFFVFTLWSHRSNIRRLIKREGV